MIYASINGKFYETLFEFVKFKGNKVSSKDFTSPFATVAVAEKKHSYIKTTFKN